MVKRSIKERGINKGRSLIDFFRIELISCMLEALKSRISGFL